MSRSYREPWTVDGYGTARKRWMKRYANRIVRNTEDVPNGNAYRRYFNPWDICDYRYKWEPWTSYYWRNGVMESYDPDPLWKARRK